MRKTILAIFEKRISKEKLSSYLLEEYFFKDETWDDFQDDLVFRDGLGEDQIAVIEKNVKEILASTTLRA